MDTLAREFTSPVLAKILENPASTVTEAARKRSSEMRPAYLTGERIFVRALAEADKDRAIAWVDSPFPINATRAEKIMEEQPSSIWDVTTTHLVIVRNDDEEIVGGVTVRSHDRRSCWMKIHMAPALPDADTLRAEALRIVIPWLRDEHEMMTSTVRIVSDESETIAAAEGLGMVLGVRLREHIARPGGRADALLYEALNARWEVRDA